MIDLHSHILPGIDDGAEDLCEAGKMLAMQYMSGVDRLFLTPHFYPAEKSIDTFLSARERAWELLSDSPASQKPMQIRLGAEVRYGEQLLSLDLRKLTLGGSCYLLLELPRRGNPAYLQDFIGELLGEGLIPILAHIEQCAYFR